MKSILTVLVLAGLSFGTIGAWDTTGLMLSINPSAYKNYGGVSKTAGLFPVFYGNSVSGTPLCTLVNMTSGYGYNNAERCIKFDYVNDYCKFNGPYMPTQTNTTDFTITAYVSYVRGASVQTIISIGDVTASVASNLFFKISSGRLYGWIARGGVGIVQTVASTADTLSTGKYMLSYVKLNDSTHLYINGSRVAAYSTYNLFALGTTSFSTYGAVGVATGGSANTDYFNGKIYWLNIYNIGMTPAQISAIYSSVDTTFYGLGGRLRADSLMSIGRIPVIDSVAPDTGEAGDTVIVYGSDWLQQKGTGWVRIDSATSQLNLDTVSWDSTQIKTIMKSVSAGAHSIQIFNSDSFGDTVSFVYQSSCTVPTLTRHATGICTVGIAVFWDHAQSGTVDSVKAITTLPAGLTIAKDGANIGRITGTPTTATAKAGYRLRAYGCSDSADAWDTITVILLPPGPLSYVTSSVRCTVGTAMTRDSIVNAGGAADSFRIAPALPAGLTLDSTTGAIYGNPTTRTASAVYTVTGYNSAGSAAGRCTLSVISATLQINSISPSSGIPTGNTTVTIRGFHFGSSRGLGSAVFGDSLAKTYTSWNDTVIVVVNKPHPKGTVSVRVTNNIGDDSTINYIFKTISGFWGWMIGTLGFPRIN